MPKPVRPRFGSMGVWPRKRAKKQTPKVRSVPTLKDVSLLGFPVYKAGMTHLNVLGTDKNKRSANIQEFVPVTVLECPPIKILSVRLYVVHEENNNLCVSKQLNFKAEKEVYRKISKQKKFSTKEDLDKINLEENSDLTVQVYTQPKIIGLKKTPEIFELSISGTLQEKLDFVKEHLEKNITIQNVFKEGEIVDSHAITTGRGFQGAVKRFGIGLKSHKSEKARRTPGSLGGWKGQGHVMYRVAHAGQTGYHLRTQHNNLIMKISDKPDEVNPKGGFINYGLIKASYIMMKGSLQGHKKRLLFLAEPTRKSSKKINFTADMIKYVSKESHQGR